VKEKEEEKEEEKRIKRGGINKLAIALAGGAVKCVSRRFLALKMALVSRWQAIPRRNPLMFAFPATKNVKIRMINASSRPRTPDCFYYRSDIKKKKKKTER
jgi:hypothetical protein